MSRYRALIVALVAAFLLGTVNAATMSGAMAMGPPAVATDAMTGPCNGSPAPQKAADCFGAMCSVFFAAVPPAPGLDLLPLAQLVPATRTSAHRGLSPGPDPEPPRADNGI